MVTIDVEIYPERAASIRAGLDPATTVITVDLDALTEEERDLLADHSGHPVTVTTPTVEDLFDALRTAAVEEQATLAEILDAHRAVLQERRVTTWRDNLPSGDAAYDVTRPDWPDSRRGAPAPGRRDWTDVMAKHHAKVHQITHGPEATEWVRELDILNNQSREQARQAQRDADEARDREQQQAIARLREWAIGNGSERVRLLIEEEMHSWLDVAEDEFFAAHTPEGFVPLVDEDHVRLLPAPDAPGIHALREARLIAATDDCLGDPILVWIGQLAGPDQTPGGPATRLTITGPHGATRLVRRWVAENSPETPNQPKPTEPAPDTAAGWLNLDDLPPPTVAEAIDELRQLLDDFEDVRMDQMTTMFYIHAFNELTTSGRQLLEALGDDPPS